MPRETTTPPRLIRVWDPGVRIFHWLLVAAIAVAFLSSEEDSALSAWHMPAGWTAAVLIAFRLAWGVVGGEHARFANFLRPSQIAPHVRSLLSGRPHPSIGHNPLGAVAVVGLLGLTAATVATGVAAGVLEDAHEAIAYGLLALIGVHVVAVLAMSHLAKDNLVLAMITGKKHASRYPDAHDAGPPVPLAAPLAALVIGGAAYGATRIDPQPFAPSLRADGAEAGDAHGEDEGGEDHADDDD